MIKTLRTIGLVSLLGAGTLVGLAGAADAAGGGFEAGILTCQSVEGTRLNLVIHSTQDIKCQFKSADGVVVQSYKGETGVGLGVDLRFTKDERFAFTVVSASKDIDPAKFTLEGRYVGAEADVALGVGGGVASLVGGGPNQIGLQPLAVKSAEGVGVAGGLSYLYLEKDAAAN